jgi:hypothetical protein
MSPSTESVSWRGRVFALMFSGVASFCWGATNVDLSQFTPANSIIGYSVYTSDSINLPDQSGLASGGLFGSGGGYRAGFRDEAPRALHRSGAQSDHRSERQRQLQSAEDRCREQSVPRKLDAVRLVDPGGRHAQLRGTTHRPMNGASTSAGTFGGMVAGDVVSNPVHTSNMAPPLQVPNTALPAYSIAGVQSSRDTAERGSFRTGNHGKPRRDLPLADRHHGVLLELFDRRTARGFLPRRHLAPRATTET